MTATRKLAGSAEGSRRAESWAGIWALFDRRVAESPRTAAVSEAGKELTYGELRARSLSLAAALIRAGQSRARPVAIESVQCLDYFVSVLAVRRLGIPFVGVDVRNPRQALTLAESCNADLMIGWSTAGEAAAASSPLAFLDARDLKEGEDAGPAGAPERPDDVLQIVATSGTSGEARGVIVSVGAILNRLRWEWDAYPYGEGARIAAWRPPEMIAGPLETFGGLLAARHTVCIERDVVLDAPSFSRELSSRRITHVGLIAPVLDQFAREAQRRPDRAPGCLVRVTSGSGLLPVTTVRRFQEAFPGVTLLNLYGLTEYSSNVAAFDCARLAPDAKRVPVGREIANTVVEICGADGSVCAPGEEGDVVVRGAGVALGIVGTGAVGATRILERGDGTHVLVTGDRGIRNDDGDVEITGRSDNSTKIRGYRVQFEDVEAALGRIPGVAAAAVAAVELPGADYADLVALIETTEGADLDLASVRRQLREMAGSHMVPRRLTVVPALPRNRNGKVKRRDLQQLIEEAAR